MHRPGCNLARRAAGAGLAGRAGRAVRATFELMVSSPTFFMGQRSTKTHV